MAVMAVFLTVAIESVSFQQRREKEQELIFRGNQAVEAIRLFRVRFGRYPVKLEELPNAKPRVLRKVWADPMTGKPDWQPVFLGEAGTTLQPTPNPSATPQPTPNADDTSQPTRPVTGGQGTIGPIIGVKSSVCQDSIMVYLGNTNYCQWKFFFDPTNPMGTTQAVVAPPAAGVPTPQS
jgi:type II secretory pathway pseudopilin PulG